MPSISSGRHGRQRRQRLALPGQGIRFTTTRDRSDLPASDR